MSLVTMREILPYAEEKKIAIPAFNIDTMEITQALLETVEEEHCPAIIAVGQAAIKDGKLESLAATVRTLAKDMKTPVVLHLDHGQSVEQVVKALCAGFTSVMIDGSKLSFEDNIAVTQEVVRIANAAGASVEAELGAILGSEDNISHDDSKPFLVRVQDVIDFTAAVKVDALAVGIGNAHGLYKGRPNLDFQRLQDGSPQPRFAFALPAFEVALQQAGVRGFLGEEIEAADFVDDPGEEGGVRILPGDAAGDDARQCGDVRRMLPEFRGERSSFRRYGGAGHLPDDYRRRQGAQGGKAEPGYGALDVGDRAASRIESDRVGQSDGARGEQRVGGDQLAQLFHGTVRVVDLPLDANGDFSVRGKHDFAGSGLGGNPVENGLNIHEETLRS